MDLEEFSNIAHQPNSKITLDEAKEAMSIAQETGDAGSIAAAEVFIAFHYLTGDGDVKQSYEEAAKWFAKAAEAGNAEAIYNLGKLATLGIGVQKDIPTAIRFFRQAADLPPKLYGFKNVGVAESQHALGLSYETGSGVDPNPIMARNWYEKSLENGYSAAAHNLGCIYFHGKGVLQNFECAVKYWKISAADGNVSSMESLEKYYLIFADFNRSKHWWLCALNSGSDTAAQRKEIHETHCYDADNKSLDILIDCHEDKMDEIALKAYCTESTALGGEFRNLLVVQDLLQSASQGSITARKLVKAIKHFVNGMELFDTTKEQDKVKMMQEYAEAYRTETIVPIWSPKNRDELLHFIEVNLKITVEHEPSDFELDMRICYVSLKMGALDEKLEFAEFSIKRFPNECYFYIVQQNIFGILQQYSESMKKIKLPLKKFPNSIPLLFINATHMRLSNNHPEEAIDAFMNLIAIAPTDHLQVPECYYSIAECCGHLLAFDSMLQFYNLGLKAEKEQLPFFLPYRCTSKDFLTNLLKMKPVQLEGTAHTAALTNPYRVQLAIAHRECCKMDNVDRQNNMHTAKSKHVQRAPSNLIGLKPITFSEIDTTKDHVYEGFVLKVSSIEDACVGGPLIMLLLADENHDVQRCFLYNFSQLRRANQIQQKIGFGSSFSILNPFLSIAEDQRPGIRIDDELSLIIDSVEDDGSSQSKKCRFCFAANNNLISCVHCKRWYCSKECQTQDSELLKHKLICTAEIS